MVSEKKSERDLSVKFENSKRYIILWTTWIFIVIMFAFLMYKLCVDVKFWHLIMDNIGSFIGSGSFAILIDKMLFKKDNSND
ncbi:MAG: hypothetical protein LBC92_05035 [Rickettsiales bacterium]|jgi:hypothetical protein|nr:hypothetical protein [Rickettsiales bacterium]